MCGLARHLTKTCLLLLCTRHFITCQLSEKLMQKLSEKGISDIHEPSKEQVVSLKKNRLPVSGSSKFQISENLHQIYRRFSGCM